MPSSEADARAAHEALTTTAHGGLVASTDPRLTDTRTPTDGSVTLAKLAPAIIDPAAGTAGARTLGTGATQALAGNTTASGIGAAPATPTVGTGLGTTGTVALDLATLNGTVQWIAATGNLTFTTSNLVAGRSVRLFIDAGGSTRTLSWPSWIAHGAALPTSLASGKRLAVSILSLGTTDGNVSAAAAAQP